MSETLFTDVECPLVPKRFLWWRWQERTHNLVTTDAWREYGHYCTHFYKKRFCLKCWATLIEVETADGP